MRRGEIWTADLDPHVGAEANKHRPVIIVANDSYNAVVARLGRGVVSIVPLTSNLAKVYDYELRLPANPITGLDVESKAQVPQVRSIDYSRFGRFVGQLPDGLLRDLDQRLRLHLGLR